LAQVVTERSAALVLYARQWTGDAGLAEDAVQDALASLLAERRPPDDPVAWMYRAVRNVAIDVMRSSSRRRRRERSVAQARGEWFEPRADALIDARAAEAALERLPPASREIVVLRIWSGLSFAQIAGRDRDERSTVHDRYAAALRQLREMLEKPCETKRKPDARRSGAGRGVRVADAGKRAGRPGHRRL
jgi:RNA polymerase sigma-70 factor (ECF subfamily)